MRCLITRNIWWTFLLLILFSGRLHAEVGVSSESDLKKRADKYFSSENYVGALPDYSRLLSLYPREIIFNFRYGVCLLEAGKEKTNASTYLDAASKDASVPEDVWYYLGKALTFNNDFSGARNAYQKFKTLAGSAKQKKYEIDSRIENCNSALALVKLRKNILILKNSEISSNAFYNNYDFTNCTGRIVNVADQFLTPIDRVKSKDAVMYIGNDKQKVFVASYGKNEETGKDIYLIRKSGDNWSEAENLGMVINSSADEDYPFLDRDGRTLFFSSKGHNSIGGYDIFKSVFNFNTKLWSKPENIGIPINTPGDDLLFVTDGNGKNATYSTNVESAFKYTTIRSIELPAGIKEVLTISGVYIPVDQQVRRDARISILTSTGDGIISSVHTDPVTGKYQIALQPGQSYMIVVEGGGYLPHAEIFDLPSGMVNPELKQVIKINKDDTKEELTLQNYFSSNGSDIPSRTITRSYPTEVDSSKMIAVTINDQIVYVNKPDPSSLKDQKSLSGTSEITIEERDEVSTVENSENDNLNSIKLKSKDKYDPTLLKGFTFDQVKQKEEEDLRKQEVSEDEKINLKEFNDNVSNEELSKIAYGEAQDLQDEADSLENEATLLREAAAERQNLSLTLKQQAETPGIEKDSTSQLISESESNRIEAELFLRQADEIAMIATSRKEESKIAFEEANSIFSTTQSTGTIASKNKKAAGNNDNPSSIVRDVAIIKGPPIPGDITTSKKNKIELEIDETEANLAVENKIGKSGTIESTLTTADTTVIENVVQATEIAENHSSNSTEEEPLTVEANSSCEDLAPPKEYDHYESIAKDEVVIVAKDSTGNKSEAVMKDAAANNEIAVAIDPKVNPAPVSDSENSKISESISNPHSETETEKSISVNVNDKKISEQNQSPEEIMQAAQDKGNVVENSTGEIVKTEESKINSENKTDLPKADTSAVAQKPIEITNQKPSVNLISENKQPIGEAPRASNPSILNMDGDTSKMPMPVAEEVRVLYREFQDKINHSNVLTQEALGLQEQLSNIPSSPERDAMIRESNAKTLESIKEWQEGLRIIQEARKLDPGVEYKMNVNDYARSNKNNKDSAAIPEKQDEPMAMANESKPAMTDLTKDPAINDYQIKSYKEDNLDTLHVDYPAYVKLKKDINAKQVQTIDVFAEAINLNKLSTEEKESELTLMDQARIEKDSVKKKELLKLSFEKKTLSEKHAKESEEKFKIAQGYIQNVRGLKTDLATLKDKITLKPGDGMTASANSKQSSAKKVVSGKSISGKTKTKTSPVYAIATASEVDLNATDEEIASANFSKEDADMFVMNGFSKNTTSPYSEKNPIPMDPTLPEGLVFKVQIGAFHKPLPSDVFKGLQPITGETTRPGWIRYCAGLFRAFEPANIVKKEIQAIGYKDAFVVAYYNGKRVDLNEAYLILKSKENLTAYMKTSAKEIAILHSINISEKSFVNSTDDRDVNSFYGKKLISGNTSISETRPSGFYAVQVGVYRSPKAPSEIASINPLQTIPAKSDFYRFTTGRFANFNSADSARKAVVESGIKDAFVVAYRSGVVINSDATENSNNTKTTSSVNNVNNNSDEIFAIGTLIYKVQIGAFRNSVPYNMIEPFINIVDKGISEKIDERGLHIFFAGKSYNSFIDAASLLDEIVAKGVKDAFVIALRNGKRIPITDEMKK